MKKKPSKNSPEPQTATVALVEERPIQPGGEASSILALVTFAVQNKKSIDEITKLTELYERLMAKKAEREFFAAKGEFQKLCPPIYKTGTATTVYKKRDSNEETKKTSHFPELSEICKVINPICQQVGLSYDWEPIQEGAKIKLSCILSHVGGHSRRVTLEAGPDDSGGKNSIQAVGSTLSYLERYTLLAIMGIAARGMDDDGNSTTSNIVDQPPMTDTIFDDVLSKVRKGVLTVETLATRFTMTPKQKEALEKMEKEVIQSVPAEEVK